MSLTHYKKFIITLLLMALTGQIMAATVMTCGMEKNSGGLITATIVNASPANEQSHIKSMAHAHHQMNDTSMHALDADNNPNHLTHTHNHQQLDCCKTSGHCYLNGCSLATIQTLTIFFLNAARSTAFDFYINISSSPIVSSLYRPPIFC